MSLKQLRSMGIEVITDYKKFVKVSVPISLIVKEYENKLLWIVPSGEHITATAVVRKGDTFDLTKGLDICFAKIYTKFINKVVRVSEKVIDMAVFNLLTIDEILNFSEKDSDSNKLAQYATKVGLSMYNFARKNSLSYARGQNEKSN